ncbi:hypothetical protein N7519_006020 [Penicillium mononematosum]|uniref:uncharacterized protein n=1 Tax=Penicillium mononematosum TaxID=268346 RepID=UPI0025468C82|nr:uncharacterized protein N7519_006020 [Penicillium mononematosum]KAJ6184719.1 hypothetical protein N7519_006020 [Penicillium mononematosum]
MLDAGMEWQNDAVGHERIERAGLYGHTYEVSKASRITRYDMDADGPVNINWGTTYPHFLLIFRSCLSSAQM